MQIKSDIFNFFQKWRLYGTPRPIVYCLHYFLHLFWMCFDIFTVKTEDRPGSVNNFQESCIYMLCIVKFLYKLYLLYWVLYSAMLSKKLWSTDSKTCKSSVENYLIVPALVKRAKQHRTGLGVPHTGQFCKRLNITVFA